MRPYLEALTANGQGAGEHCRIREAAAAGPRAKSAASADQIAKRLRNNIELHELLAEFYREMVARSEAAANLVKGRAQRCKRARIWRMVALVDPFSPPQRSNDPVDALLTLMVRSPDPCVDVDLPVEADARLMGSLPGEHSLGGETAAEQPDPCTDRRKGSSFHQRALSREISDPDSNGLGSAIQCCSEEDVRPSFRAFVIARLHV